MLSSPFKLFLTLMVPSLVLAQADPLPEVPGARIDRSFSVTSNALLVHYASSNVTDSKITHALFVVHGLQRDAWNAFKAAQASVTAAASAGLVQASQVHIAAPVFFNGNDRGAFPVDADGNPTTNQLVWQGSGWSDGAENRFPTSNTNVSSFLAMDALVTRYANTTRFPSLKNVILIGHSAGGQTTQRWALVGARASNPAPGISNFRYVVANPGSYAYLNEARPRPNASCTDFNDWKYGLKKYPHKYNAQTVAQRPSELAQRFVDLPIGFLYGAEPDAAGVPLDDSCGAETQGTTHKARTRNFFDVLREQFQTPETRQYAAGVPGVAHDAAGVFASPVGVRALFAPLGKLLNATEDKLYLKVTADGYTVSLKFAFDSTPKDGFRITFDLREGQTVGAVRGAQVESTTGQQVVLRGTVVGEVQVDIAGPSANKANGFQVAAV